MLIVVNCSIYVCVYLERAAEYFHNAAAADDD